MTRLRLMLDSNISDELLADDSLRSEIRRRVDTDALDVLITHIQVDENLSHPDREAGRRLIHGLMGAGARAVPTYGVVVDISRVGSARIADEQTSAMVEAFAGSNPKQFEDALIAATALRERAVFVTAEKRTGRFRRHFPGLDVWSLEDLRSHLARSQQDPLSIALMDGTRASGSLMTPAFEGPGHMDRTATVATGELSDPEFVVGLVMPGESLALSNGVASTSFSQRLEAVENGVRLSVSVTRDGSGTEPEHVFLWSVRDRAL